MSDRPYFISPSSIYPFAKHTEPDHWAWKVEQHSPSEWGLYWYVFADEMWWHQKNFTYAAQALAAVQDSDTGVEQWDSGKAGRKQVNFALDCWSREVPARYVER